MIQEMRQLKKLMLKSYKSSLQLNSYKLDTTAYQQQLQQLTLENQQLKTAIHSLKLKEHQLLQQLHNAKHENGVLKSRTSLQLQPSTYSPPKQQSSNCRQCSQKQLTLDREKEKSAQYKEMYENELQNKKDLAEYYENKLHALLRDKDALVNKYEQKIKFISQPNVSSKNTDSSTSIGNQLKQTIPQSSPIALRKYPPSQPKTTPPKISSIQGKTGNKINGLSSLDSLLKPCLQRLSRMSLTLDELKYIQQIDRFSQGGPVTKNRYIKLMREFPFECDNEEEVELSFEPLLAYIRQQGQEDTGANFMTIILTRMKQLQA